MVGRHAHVRRPLPQQLQDGADHAPHGGDLLPRRGAVWGGAEEVAEQLVGPVDQVHLHDGTESVTARAVRPPPPRAWARKARSASFPVRAMRRVVGGGRVGRAAEAAEQVGPHGVEEVVRLERQPSTAANPAAGPSTSPRATARFSATTGDGSNTSSWS